MSAVVVGWETEPTRNSPVSQPSAAAAQSSFYPTRVACAASRIAGYRLRVGTRAGDRQCRSLRVGDPACAWETNLPAINLSRLRLPGSLSFGHSALRFLQDPSRRSADLLHVFSSLLPTAEQCGRKVRQSVVKE